MTTVLDVEFENSNGKEQHLRLKGFDPRKSAEEIKATLEKITLLNLFEKDGVGLYKKIKHATVIEKTERPIFDKTAEGILPAAQLTEETTLTKVQKPAKDLDKINIPEDLVITEEKPEPDILIQTIGLPEGVELEELSEAQAMIIITACMPANARLEDIRIDNRASPAKLVLTERTTEEEPPRITQSPPEKAKKKRKRLLDRIRKRE